MIITGRTVLTPDKEKRIQAYFKALGRRKEAEREQGYISPFPQIRVLLRKGISSLAIREAAAQGTPAVAYCYYHYPFLHLLEEEISLCKRVIWVHKEEFHRTFFRGTRIFEEWLYFKGLESGDHGKLRGYNNSLYTPAIMYEINETEY